MRSFGEEGGLGNDSACMVSKLEMIEPSTVLLENRGDDSPAEREKHSESDSNPPAIRACDGMNFVRPGMVEEITASCNPDDPGDRIRTDQKCDQKRCA